MLIVERFDRRLAPGGTHWLRLPQEDMCQALGVPSALKYESDGGPGVRSIMDLLLGSRTPDTDRWMFFRAQVVFWMLCAIDGHAKNFSIAIGSGGRFALTPLYDVLSAWPVVGRGANQLARERARMAMAVLSRNRHDRWTEIQPRHWASTARACGLDPDEANRVVLQTATLAPAAIERAQAALPPWFPGDVSGPILDGVGDAAERLVRGLAR